MARLGSNSASVSNFSLGIWLRLVGSLEWRHGLALVLVQGRADHAPVAEVDAAVGLLLERQGVLHPVLIIPVGEVFSGMSTTRLLPVGCRDGSLSAEYGVSIAIDRPFLFAPEILTRK